MKAPRTDSYLAPQCAEVSEHGWRFVRAITPISKGSLIAAFGGRTLTIRMLQELPVTELRFVIQVDEGLYLQSLAKGPADQINHSCTPNAGLRGQISLVAMRDIEAGETVTFDYAMSHGSPFNQFACRCGSPACRGRMTGSDWRRPELWSAYAGYFSPYLALRIRDLQLASRGESAGLRARPASR